MRTISKHELGCAYKPEPCRFCGGLFPAVERQDHEARHCLERPIACARCHEHVKAAAMDGHLKADWARAPGAARRCASRSSESM